MVCSEKAPSEAPSGDPAGLFLCPFGSPAGEHIRRLLAVVGEDRERLALASPQIHPNSANLGHSTAKLFLALRTCFNRLRSAKLNEVLIMILAASGLEDDSQDVTVMRRTFWPALSDQISVLGAIESLRLESARPSEVYQKIVDNVVVDPGVLNAAIANRVLA